MDKVIDIERLRKDLIDYFESAFLVGGYGAALLESSNIRTASDEELMRIAINNNFNIDNYTINIKYRKLV